jgi:hypothetical protein
MGNFKRQDEMSHNPRRAIDYTSWDENFHGDPPVGGR